MPKSAVIVSVNVILDLIRNSSVFPVGIADKSIFNGVVFEIIPAMVEFQNVLSKKYFEVPPVSSRSIVACGLLGSELFRKKTSVESSELLKSYCAGG